MQTVTQSEFEALIRGAKLIERDRHGPKVYETLDGKVIKLLRVKRWLSSNLLCPYAIRFKRNAGSLAVLGIPSLRVERVGHVPHIKRQMVIYPWLPGSPLRHALRDSPAQEAARLMRQAGSTIAKIHEKGVYFRSIHFGNLLIHDDETGISLIDILDLAVLRKPLGFRRRLRNFCHMIRYEEDRASLIEHWDHLLDGYESWVRENAPQRASILNRLFQTWHRRLHEAHHAGSPKT